MKIEPYLFFEGRCDEALEFYKKVFGAEVTMLMRFNEAPDPAMCPTGAGDKVMHSNFRIGDSTVMASDGRCQGPPAFQGFSLSVSLADAAEAERIFNALSDGGKVQMPLAKTFWSPSFGMVFDRFGLLWMINVMPEG